MPVFKTDKDNPEKELDFELDYQLSLSTAQRFKMMFEKSREMLKLMQKHGHRKTFEVIKRT